MDKRFVPKRYAEGKINQDNCNHELLSTFGFDEGLYGKIFDCLICGKHLNYGIYQKFDEKNKFIINDFGCLTPYNIELAKHVLSFIARRYVDEKSIDIVRLFNEIYPSLENICSAINPYTEMDKLLIKRKYRHYRVKCNQK